MSWLDKIPMTAMIIAALVLGLAPVVPEPHLWQKLKMLAYGALSQPIDIFDLIMHASVPVLVGVKLFRGKHPGKDKRRS